MKIDTPYLINQHKTDSHISLLNGIELSPLFSLKLKPQIVEQIQIVVKNGESHSEEDLSVSIEFVSEKEAILWVGNSIQYKLAIAPLNGINTHRTTSSTQSSSSSSSSSSEVESVTVNNSENQHEVYTSTSPPSTSKEDSIKIRCRELHYIGNVSHHMVPIFQSSNTTKPTGNVCSLRDSISVSHSTLSPEAAVISKANLSSSITPRPVPTTTATAAVAKAKKKVTNASINTTSLSTDGHGCGKQIASKSTSAAASSSSMGPKTLVLRYLNWNISDSDIQHFFSTLSIDHIYATQSSLSTTTSTNNQLTNSSSDLQVTSNQVNYVDFYVTFQSSSAAEIAYLRSGEIIKFSTRRSAKMDGEKTLSSKKRTKMNTDKSLSTSSSCEVRLERVSDYESQWAQCIGVDWSDQYNDKFNSVSVTSGVVNYDDDDNDVSDDNIIDRNSLTTCQQRYLFIHTLFGNHAVAPAPLVSFIHNSPKQLMSLYPANPSNNSMFNNSTDTHNISTNSNSNRNINDKKQNVKNSSSSSSLSVLELSSNHYMYEHNKTGLSSGINSHFRPFPKEPFQYVGSNWLDENRLFGNQSSYFFLYDDVSNHRMTSSSSSSSRSEMSQSNSGSSAMTAVVTPREAIETAVELLDQIKRNIIEYYTSHHHHHHHHHHHQKANNTININNHKEDDSVKNITLTGKRKAETSIRNHDINRSGQDECIVDNEWDNDKDVVNVEFNLKADLLIYYHLTRLINMLYVLYKHE